MIRMRTLFLTVLPSMVAGGFLFASAFGHAETGRDLGMWPAAADTSGRVLVAQNDPWAHRNGRMPVPPVPPPAPPAPPAPVAPVAPVAPYIPHGKHGIQVRIEDGKVQLDGLAEMIEGQLEGVNAILENLPDVPPEVRTRVRERIRSVRRTVKTRMSKLKSMDLSQIGPEMERMGDEIEREMEGLDKDMEKLGDKLGQQFAKKITQQVARSFQNVDRDNDGDDNDEADHDDDDDSAAAAVMPPGPNVDAVPPSLGDLKNLTLRPQQKADLAKLRAETDQQVKAAKQALDEASGRLHDTLGNSNASEAEIARQIDAVSREEATIRKARILAWVKARNLLDKDQRRKVEAAAHH